MLLLKASHIDINKKKKKLAPKCPKSLLVVETLLLVLLASSFIQAGF